jgi:hypothetical protein
MTQLHSSSQICEFSAAISPRRVVVVHEIRDSSINCHVYVSRTIQSRIVGG